MKSERPLVVAGSGRSGTTWVVDALAAANGLKTVFEPLREIVGSAAASYANRYIPSGREEPELEQLLARAFEGELPRLWARYRLVPRRLRPTVRALHDFKEAGALYRSYRKLLRNVTAYHSAGGQGYVTKLIRANLLLEWICGTFNARVLFVVRHPGAVVESRMRLFETSHRGRLTSGADAWHPDRVLLKYTSDQELKGVYLAQLSMLAPIETLSTVGRLALIWCIENSLPLQQARDGLFTLTFYEMLNTQGVNEWPRVSRALGLPAFPSPAQSARPSEQASADFVTAADMERRSRWMARLTDEQKSEIDAVLEAFRIEEYRCSDPMPALTRASAEPNDGVAPPEAVDIREETNRMRISSIAGKS